MKTMKGRLVLLSVLTVAVGLYSVSRARVNAYRGDDKYTLHAAASPLPPAVVKILAGEFKGLVADYLLLEAASFNGSRQSFRAGSEDWDAVARLLEQSSTLDPYFRSTYRLAQSTLPWRAKKTDAALTILKRSSRHLLWDWEPDFFMGFDHFFFLKDNLRASEHLMEAARRADPSNAVSLASWASRLASKAGQTRAGIEFLIAVYEKSEDEEHKKVLLGRIKALQGVLELQMAIDRFNEKFGHMPSALDELVERSILTELPTNPYGRPYILKNGEVDF